LLLFFRKEDPCFKSSGIGRKGGIAGMRGNREIKKHVALDRTGYRRSVFSAIK